VTRLKTLCKIKDCVVAVKHAPEGMYAQTLLTTCEALLASLIKSEEQFADYLRYTLGDAE
jgi:hypothetical protein